MNATAVSTLQTGLEMFAWHLVCILELQFFFYRLDIFMLFFDIQPVLCINLCFHI